MNIKIILTIFAICAQSEAALLQIQPMPKGINTIYNRVYFFDTSNTNFATEGPDVALHTTDTASDKYFYVESKRQLNWMDAEEECQKIGGHLASIESAEEANALHAYLQKLDNVPHPWRFWLSANDMETEGDFKWLSLTTPMSYTNWGELQPDDYDNMEDCVVLWRQCDETWLDNNGVAIPHNCWNCNYPKCDWDKCWNLKWNDVPCTVVSNYVCETSRLI